MDKKSEVSVGGWQQPCGTSGREALHVGTSDFRGLVVLEEHPPTSHLLSESPGSER